MSDIQVRGPKDCATTLSHNGETYTAKKGIFTVPEAIFEHLHHHGFKAVGAQADDDAKTEPKAEAQP